MSMQSGDGGMGWTWEAYGGGVVGGCGASDSGELSLKEHSSLNSSSSDSFPDGRSCDCPVTTSFAPDT